MPASDLFNLSRVSGARPYQSPYRSTYPPPEAGQVQSIGQQLSPRADGLPNNFLRIDCSLQTNQSRVDQKKLVIGQITDDTRAEFATESARHRVRSREDTEDSDFVEGAESR